MRWSQINIQTFIQAITNNKSSQFTSKKHKLHLKGYNTLAIYILTYNKGYETNTE